MSPAIKKKPIAKKAARKTAAKKKSAGKKVSKKQAGNKVASKKKIAGKKPPKKKSARKPPAISVTPEERYNMIAVAAYLKAEKRGFAPGNELRDWAEAEKEVDKKLRG